MYLVDRDLPGVTIDQFAAAQRAALETARRFTAEGRPVRYIRSTFIPGEARSLCLFEAADAGQVRMLNEAAHIPFTRVSEAVDLTPGREGT
jgi:hypothetical protein